MFAPRPVLRLASLLGLLVALPVMLATYTPAAWPLDVKLHAVGRDFLNLWAGGRLLWEGAWQILFDHHTYQHALHRLFDPQVKPHIWSYPPTSFFLAAPLSLLPYGFALAVWTLGGLIALVAAARIGLEAQALKRAAFLLLLAPATLVNAICGQNGFLTAALLGGGVLLLERRPWLAGVLIGLLSYKPHFGIVIAPVLLALGAWRTIAAAAATALAMVLASIVVFGTGPWIAFVNETLPYQDWALRDFSGFFSRMLVSPYAALREFGLTHGSAMVVQALVSVGAVAACAVLVRRTRDADTRLQLVAAATFLATPYALTYDLPIIALVIWRLAVSAPHASWGPLRTAVLGAAWAVPLLGMPLNIMGAPIVPLILVALFLDALQRPETSSAGNEWTMTEPRAVVQADEHRRTA